MVTVPDGAYVQGVRVSDPTVIGVTGDVSWVLADGGCSLVDQKKEGQAGT